MGIDIKHISPHIKHTLWLPKRDAGCPIDSDINLHIEDMEGINTGLINHDESTSSPDTTVALGGSEAEGYPNELIPSNQATLTALAREINDLHQLVEAREGQPAESLDHIEQELQNLSLMLQPQPSPTPTEPFGEVICEYTDTLCAKQTSLIPYYKRLLSLMSMILQNLKTV